MQVGKQGLRRLAGQASGEEAQHMAKHIAGEHRTGVWSRNFCPSSPLSCVGIVCGIENTCRALDGVACVRVPGSRAASCCECVVVFSIVVWNLSQCAKKTLSL
jgi:hypothetical protein